MHQIRLVEQMPIQLDGLRVLHQHVAGLADTGQQLVDGLRGVDDSRLGANALFAHRMVGAVKRMKRSVRQPGFVEMQVFYIAIEHAFDGFCVVQNAIVGTLRDRHHTRFNGFGIHAIQVLEQRIGLDLGLNRFDFKFFLRNRADDAEVIPCRLQKHRNCSRHDDGVQN